MSATTSLAESGADVRGMFNRIARRYDATNRAMSVGVDIRWRKQAIARLIEGTGETPLFLDLGAGTLDGALEIRAAAWARVAADFARGCWCRKPKVKDTPDRWHAADGHHLPYRDAAFDARSRPHPNSPICRAACASSGGGPPGRPRGL